MSPWLILAAAAALLAAWAAGYAAGQRSRRELTPAAQVRSMRVAYHVMGYDDDAARKLLRETAASSMRQAGVWNP